MWIKIFLVPFLWQLSIAAGEEACAEPAPVPNAYRNVASCPEGSNLTCYEYTCYPGYNMTSGSANRTCQNGALLGDPPVCTLNCGEPARLPGHNVTVHNLSVAVYTCADNASMSATVQCDNSRGYWQLPDLQCTVPPFIANICESSSFPITCSTNHWIEVLEAFYGRTDNDTCTGREIKDLNCGEDRTPTVSALCQNTSTCELSANNNLFGDTCPKTYKYLRVTYLCKTDMSTALCPSPPVIPHHVLVTSVSSVQNFTSGTQVEYECVDHMYYLYGNRIAVCTGDGTWAGPGMKCIDDENRVQAIEAPTDQSDLHVLVDDKESTCMDTPAALTSVKELTVTFRGEVEVKWITIAQSEYVLFSGSTNYSDAKENCDRISRRLPIITSQADQTKLEHFLDLHRVNGHAYLGLEFDDMQTWTWNDNTPLQFSNLEVTPNTSSVVSPLIAVIFGRNKTWTPLEESGASAHVICQMIPGQKQVQAHILSSSKQTKNCQTASKGDKPYPLSSERTCLLAGGSYISCDQMPVGVAVQITSAWDYDLLTGLCEVRVFGRLYNGPLECFQSEKGEEYKGHQDTTDTGQPCTEWNLFYDGHMHSFPDMTPEERSKRCRVLTGTDNLKCGGGDCQGVGSCSQCQIKTGENYEGTLSFAGNGHTCLHWNNSKLPAWRVEDFPDGSRDHNYCRNPGGSWSRPWCYTNDNSLDFGGCHVDICDVTCKKPKSENFYNVTDYISSRTNTSVNYTCVDGYLLTSGNLTRTCNKDAGIFRGLPPTCSKICPNSSNSTENLNVTQGERDVYTEGQNVTYGCREGWFNNGSQLVQTCQSNGTWSNQTEEFTECQKICPNSNISTEMMNVTHEEPAVYTEGQNVTYSCRDGWFNNGSQLVQTCQSNGTWSNRTEASNFTECRKICPIPSISSMKVMEGEQDVYTEGQNVTYGCGKGWFNNGSQLVQVCQSDGTWNNLTDASNFTECLKQCGRPPLKSGFYTPPGRYYEGMNVTYRCANGTYPEGGNITLTCSSDGAWVNLTEIPVDLNCNNSVHKHRMCPCRCGVSANVKWLKDNIETVIAQIKKNLTLDPKTLSSYRRRKTTEQAVVQTSQMAVGGVAVAMMVIVFGSIVVNDTAKFVYYLVRRWRRFRKKRRVKAQGMV